MTIVYVYSNNGLKLLNYISSEDDVKVKFNDDGFSLVGTHTDEETKEKSENECKWFGKVKGFSKTMFVQELDIVEDTSITENCNLFLVEGDR
jgi:hypothetical protein